MIDGYLHEKVRSQEEQIRELKNNLTTLRIAVESQQRRTNKLEDDTKIVNDLDTVIQKLVSLNREQAEKEFQKIKLHLENCIVATTNYRLEDYKKTEKKIEDFLDWFRQNNVVDEMLEHRSYLSTIFTTLTTKKIETPEELLRLFRKNQRKIKKNRKESVV